MPNSDGEVAMNEAHEKLRELLVAIRSVLTKYKECVILRGFKIFKDADFRRACWPPIPDS